MDRTAELRWFFRKPPPQPIVAWFERTSGPPATRTDCYLLLPGTDALGVKVRGGTTRLELKLRTRPPGSLSLPGGATGQLEEWQRWSLPRSGITRLFPRLALPKERWVEVAKQRRLTTIPSGNDAGCRVELTALRAQGQAWSTVGFESFGPDADLVPALEAAADELFGSIDLPGNLGADCSGGYPGWLATL
jgi:hypothetical protein